MASNTLHLAEDWQSKTIFPASIWKLFVEQVGCDVVFEVGQFLERRGAHTSVLMARSVVFFNEFAAGPPALEIQLPEFQPEEFDCFLEYLYTGILKTSLGLNIMKVLELAERYRVMELVKMLVSKQINGMNLVDFCPFVRKNEHHMSKLIKFKCLEYVFKQPEAVFKSHSFKLVPLSFLTELLSHDRLVLDENIIWDAVLQWSENECNMKGIPVTGENRRKVLQDAVFELRPTLLSKEYFEEKISDAGILTDAEELVVVKHLLKSKKAPGTNFQFKTEKRVAPSSPFTYSPTEEEAPDTDQHMADALADVPIEHPLSAGIQYRADRFAERGIGWGYRTDKKDAIALNVSQNIRIDYIYLYGPCNSDGIMEVTLVIQDEKFELSSTEVKVPCQVAEPVYEVGVENANGSYGVRLNAYETYHIVVTIKGESGYYGKKGVSSVTVGGVKIAFSDSRFSSNNTNVRIGQIAGFKFSIV